MIGLCMAAKRFDYRKGYRFSTCAIPWIKQAITKSLTDRSRPIRLPAHIYQKIVQMNKILSENNGELTDGQLAEKMGIAVEKVAMLKQWKQTTISLDTPLDDEDKNTVGDLVPDVDGYNPEKYFREQDLHEQVQKVLSTLPERTQIIMKMRLLDIEMH